MKTICLLCLYTLISSLTFASDLVFPWVTYNDNFQSQIAINNPYNRNANISLHATRKTADSSETQQVDLVLNPFANLVFDVGQAFPDFAGGTGFSVRLQASHDKVQASYIVNATSTESGQSPAQDNIVRADDASQTILFNLLQAQEEGYAAPVVTNLGESDTEVTFTAYQSDVAVATASQTVTAGTSYAAGVTELFPEISGDLYVIATADQPLVGVSFIFNSIGEPSMAAAVSLDEKPGLDNDVTVSTIASDIGIVDAVSIGPDGNIYVSDFLGGESFSNASGTRILQITPTGEVSTFTDQVVTPLGQAWDSQGNLYVSSFTEGNLRRVAPDKTVTIIASGYNGPSGVALDSQDNIYVAEYNGGRTIYKVTPAGESNVFVHDPQINGPAGISFDENDNLYIGNYNDGKVFRASPDGTLTQIAQVNGVRNFTMGYLTYANGELYATGIGKNLIYRITLDGEVSLLAGSGAFNLVDGNASEAAFAYPNGITASPDGSKLYISSFAGRVLRVIDLNND
jgi:sugar lactone lactonase YvrE